MCSGQICSVRRSSIHLLYRSWDLIRAAANNESEAPMKTTVLFLVIAIGACGSNKAAPVRPGETAARPALRSAIPVEPAPEPPPPHDENGKPDQASTPEPPLPHDRKGKPDQALTRGTISAGRADPREVGRWTGPVKVTGEVGGNRATAAMLVYLPRGYPVEPGDTPAGDESDQIWRYPLVIALHGWNHTPEVFRDKGDLAHWADAYGLVIALPAMGTTVYETSLYPETKRPWATVPGTPWVAEVILPYLRTHYHVRKDRAHTAVIGYSTGGRGAVLLAETYPEFGFAGSVSGTFDLMRLDPRDGEYKIHAAVYGPRNKFKERWDRDNCISAVRLSGLTGSWLYIAHSRKDAVVSFDQLVALQDALHDNTTVKAEFVVSQDGGHTWPYWNAQWEGMFRALATVMQLDVAPSAALP